MTITITKLSKSQWLKVAKVFFWLALSAALAIVTAWIAKNKAWLATDPAYNFVLVFLTQLFQQEEQTAAAEVPASVAPAVNQVVAQVQAKIPPIQPPSTPN